MQDHPFAAFQSADLSSEEEIDGRPVYRSERGERKTPVITPEERLMRELSSSEIWGEEPAVEGQDMNFPETVRDFAFHFETLNPGKQDDKILLNRVHLSNERRGRFVLVRPPEYRYNESLNQWSVLLVYRERRFKQLDQGTRPGHSPYLNSESDETGE